MSLPEIHKRAVVKQTSFRVKAEEEEKTKEKEEEKENKSETTDEEGGVNADFKVVDNLDEELGFNIEDINEQSEMVVADGGDFGVKIEQQGVVKWEDSGDMGVERYRKSLKEKKEEKEKKEREMEKEKDVNK